MRSQASFMIHQILNHLIGKGKKSLVISACVPVTTFRSNLSSGLNCWVHSHSGFESVSSTKKVSCTAFAFLARELVTFTAMFQATPLHRWCVRPLLQQIKSSETSLLHISVGCYIHLEQQCLLNDYVFGFQPLITTKQHQSRLRIQRSSTPTLQQYHIGLGF